MSDSVNTAKRARKAGIASYVGTTIEWYDFYIYGAASALVFGHVFFPDNLPDGVGTLLSFVTMWAGFIARPLGGIVFGHFGDKYGRKKTLVVTLILMGAASFVVGLLPGYSTIGLAAPILLTFLRVLQGIAVGGEWGGSVLIASESAPKGKSILYSAFAQQGSPTGNLLATGAFFFLAMMPTPEFILYGWRIAFLASILLIVIGLVIRLKLEEPQIMQQARKKDAVVKVPVVEAFKKHWALILIGAGALPLVQVTYLKTTFATAWATDKSHDWAYGTSSFLGIVAIALVVQFIVQPFGAVILSRVKDMRKAIFWIVVPEFVLMPLMFFAIQTGNTWLAILGMAAATVPHSMFYAGIGGILARAFPAKVRYTGISLSYQLCSMTVAGATPALAQWMYTSTDTIMPVAILGASYAVVSLICTLILLQKTGWVASEDSNAEKAEKIELAEETAEDERLAALDREDASRP
ncbi:MFS transporter [Brevibacterium aurantiacum]|uniref:MHS family MFS transporter n=1 Tax=Brevibacterium aurantiacum TaxID=273384 RepID=A0A556CC18_BREAU|nr:MFS transporter [Brevibacterium aurantiacum]TSI14973.1 MHS family MFS transporter [Brevibacterium aurantiacum]